MLSGNGKCLDQRAREESGEKVKKKPGQNGLYSSRAGGGGGPLKGHVREAMTRPVL